MAALLLGQVSTRVLASDEELFRAIDEGKELVAEGLVVRGRANIVRLLLRHTADPDLRNRSGQSPADYARSRGYRPIVRLLEGAD